MAKTKAKPPVTGLIADEEPVVDLDEAEEVIPFTYSITAYGADYPVDSLVKRINAKDIIVPAFGRQPTPDSEIVGFQREYVWPRPKADRFIESLLLGLPVPGIFLVKEASGVFLVLDGHQRLYTLRAFYDGIIDGEEYRLENVQKRFVGKSYKDLDTEDRRRLDDSIIHSTIVRQDEPTEDQSSVYVIFERLNTGGINLQPQEIRVALYHGEFARVLRSLNENKAWRALYGKKSRRLKDTEMILRFFALYYHGNNYRSPMKDFLNRYMAGNRELQRQSEKELKGLFSDTAEIIFSAIGQKALRPRGAVNAAVVDSLMTGIATRLSQKGQVKSKEQLRKQYDSLLNTRDYLAAVETGTAREAIVETRVRLAKMAFAEVQ